MVRFLIDSARLGGVPPLALSPFPSPQSDRSSKKGDDPHRPPTLLPQQEIDRIDLSNVVGPPLRDAARAGGWEHLDDVVRSLASLVFVRLSPPPSADGAAPAGVPDQVLAVSGDMGGQGGQPVQDGTHLEVPREDRMRSSTRPMWRVVEL